MEWAELVLAYVEALAWPAVVGAVVFGFRRQIAAKVADLKDASTPVGAASFFDRAAKAAGEQAERAMERQEEATKPLPPPRAEPEPQPEPELREQLARRELYVALSAAVHRLTEPSDFDGARAIATESPRAAVMLAYAELEKVLRAAWTVTRMEPPPRGGVSVGRVIRSMGPAEGVDAGLLDIAHDLSELRSRIAHADDRGVPEVSVEGAQDYIGACEQLARGFSRSAMSRLRHPSRAPLVRDWMEWAGRENPAKGSPEGKEPAT